LAAEGLISTSYSVGKASCFANMFDLTADSFDDEQRHTESTTHQHTHWMGHAPALTDQ